MPDAALVAIADAVVSAINGASFTYPDPVVAERAYVPLHELDDLAVVKVTVVLRDTSMVTLSRADDDFDFGIDVGVQRKIGTGAMTVAEIRAACDPLMLLVEEMLDLFRSRSGLALVPARFIGATVQPVYVAAHLDEKRVFTSVIGLTYRERR